MGSSLGNLGGGLCALAQANWGAEGGAGFSSSTQHSTRLHLGTPGLPAMEVRGLLAAEVRGLLAAEVRGLSALLAETGLLPSALTA